MTVRQLRMLLSAVSLAMVVALLIVRSAFVFVLIVGLIVVGVAYAMLGRR